MNRLLAFSLAILLAVANPAQAQLACDKREVVIRTLEEKYGEARIGMGFIGPSAIFEIWASNEPPYSWTLLKTTPNGLTCLMAVGDNWRNFTPDYSPKLTPS